MAFLSQKCASVAKYLSPKLYGAMCRVAFAAGAQEFAGAREPFYPVGREPRWLSADDSLTDVLKSGDDVYVQGIAATPTVLLDGLCHHVMEKDLTKIKLHHLHLEGKAAWAEPPYDEIPRLFRRSDLKLNLALIHVSPPDLKGFCSLGTSVDVSRAAIINAQSIVALANPNMPRTFGDGIVHKSHIDVMVYGQYPLYERHSKPADQQETRIGKLIAENLVDDGATLQMGIGAIPDAALAELKGHKDLGIHTEMFSDGVLDLVECGVITNANKKIHPGKIVSSFVFGSKRCYDFLHNNPIVFMGDISWVNDTGVIRQNPKVTAINSAVEVDLTGQVVADSVGKRFISGFGGQVDFIRGAGIANDQRGRPIIALPSVTKKGGSKIVPFIQSGAGVVTTRGHVHYVVTEYGIAHLFGKNLRQRACDLISIAHPDHRETLEKAAYDRLKCMPTPE